MGVAETAIALMLGVYKRLCVADSSVRAGQWLKWELRTGCKQICVKGNKHITNMGGTPLLTVSCPLSTQANR